MGADDPGGHTLNKRSWSAVSGLAVGALVVTGLTAPGQAQATPTTKAPVSSDPAEAQASRHDNLPNPLADKANAERKDAVTKLIKGEATTKTINGNRVIEVKSATKNKAGRAATQSRFINYPVDREEDIFTILTDLARRRCPASRRRPARCTTRSRSPTVCGTRAPRTTTPLTGSPTSAASTSWT